MYDLMKFDAGNDRIEPNDLLDMGQSELVGRNRPELMEGDMVGQANNMF